VDYAADGVQGNGRTDEGPQHLCRTPSGREQEGEPGEERPTGS